MKTTKLLQFLVALMLIASMTSCGSTYYNSRYNYGRHYSHRHYVPPRPYGGNYGYGRRGW